VEESLNVKIHFKSLLTKSGGIFDKKGVLGYYILKIAVNLKYFLCTIF